jgi:transcriptional regulator with XRE-family HTH domain
MESTADPHVLLAQMIETHGLPKAEVARRLGVQPQAVTNWTRPGNGNRPTRPSHENIVKLDDLLGAGGDLLRAFGYVVDSVTAPSTTEAAIRADSRFSRDDKELLLRLVANFAARSKKP